MNETEAKIIEILQALGVEKIEDTSATLTVDLALDSLQMVTLLIMLEDTFKIELDESDMDPFALVTVDDIVELIQKYTAYVEVKQNE